MRKYTPALLLLTMAFTGCSAEQKPFQIENYLIVTETGYSEYGTVNVTVDYNKMYQENKSLFNKQSIAKEQLQEDVLEISYDAKTTWANNDIVEIQIQDNTNDDIDLEAVFEAEVYKTIPKTLSQLTPLQEYDPFADLIVTPVGISGEGYIIGKIEHYSKEGSWEWPVTVHSDTATNGERVKLTIDNLDIDTIQQRFGIKLTTTEHEYTVSTMSDRLKDSDDLRKVSADNIQALNKVIEDWVVSGQNDENPNSTNRQYQYKTAVLFTSPTETKICFIYHISDGIVPNGYYIYISPTQEVYVDNVNQCLVTKNGKNLSSSFALYDKETIRYTEEWGWGQDYERHGFMYNNIPYAGKLTLQEEVDYLAEIYPNYTTIYQKGE